MVVALLGPLLLRIIPSAKGEWIIIIIQRRMGDFGIYIAFSAQLVLFIARSLSYLEPNLHGHQARWAEKLNIF